jgi:hypothetical protein
MSRYHRFIKLILGLVLLILPFQYLWIRPIELVADSNRSVFLLTNWYELLIIAALPTLAIFFLKRRLFWFDWLLFGVLALAVISSYWSPATGWTDVIGLRYGVGFIVFYFIARSILAWQASEKLLTAVFYLVVAIALGQGLFWLMGGESNFWFLAKRDLAGDLPRLYASLIGPNQLGTYVACLGLWLYHQRRISGWWFGLAALVVIGTFSRSALLGLLAGYAVIIYQWRSVVRWKLVGAAVGLGLALALPLVFFYSDSLRQTFVVSRHTDERLSALQKSIEEFNRASLPVKLFGYGITTAGPSTFVTKQIFVPENWFLQVLHEIGLVGLFSLLAAILGALRFLSQRGSSPLVSPFVAIAVNSLFLHPLADNPAVAITLFTLLASAVNAEERKRILK